jgi:ABC-type dipeptide/oligopeptide/nickel transport system ATPase component
MSEAPLLSVRNLSLGVQRKGRPTTVIVDDISFDVAEGERFGIVGESGSGKSMTLRAIANLLPAGVTVLSGAIEYRGENLQTMSVKSRRRLAGPEIAMIFQEPMSALNPVMRVGEQIAESPRRHLGLSKSAAMDLAIDMMRKTGIPDPARRAQAYPHELSGGLRQRIMIAMALSCSPKLLLCDEPTTALDVTVQHQVLRLLEQLCEDTKTALVFVTHDLGVVNQTCLELGVMYAGEIVERGRVKDVFADPRHPYTKGLLDARTGARSSRVAPSRSSSAPPPVRGWNASCRGARRPASKPRASSRERPHDGRHRAADRAARRQHQQGIPAEPGPVWPVRRGEEDVTEGA